MQIAIPDPVRGTLGKVLSLDEKDFKVLLQGLSQCTPALKPRAQLLKLKKQVSKKLVDLVEDVLDMLKGMYLALYELSVEPQEFTRMLLVGARSDNMVVHGGWEQAEARLNSLLLLEPLGISAKAHDLYRLRARTLCESRLISDIRPVFTSKGERILAAFPVHTLVLTFHKMKGHAKYTVREEQIQLDTEDIEKLKAACERALRKDIELKEFVAKTQVPWLSDGE